MNLKDKELELWYNWKQTSDPEIKTKLVRSLDPLLQGQVNKFNGSNIPKSALKAEARKLALGAFDTYDPTKSQLNTHVTNHLKHLQRYVLQYQNVGKIPEHRGILINKFNTVKQNLEDQLGREPTTTELSDGLQWSPIEVERMQLELRKDLMMGAEEEETFFDKDYFKQDVVKELKMMAYYSATPQEKLIMEYTFGMGGKPKKTVTEISKLIHLPEQQIRAIRSNLAKSINDASRYVSNG